MTKLTESHIVYSELNSNEDNVINVFCSSVNDTEKDLISTSLPINSNITIEDNVNTMHLYDPRKDISPIKTNPNTENMMPITRSSNVTESVASSRPMTVSPSVTLNPPSTCQNDEISELLADPFIARCRMALKLSIINMCVNILYFILNYS